MRTPPIRKLTFVGASALLLSTLTVGTAEAAHVGCASVITASTTLDSDIGPCPGDGIIIGADNITLNLNGHRIIGEPGPSADGNSVGIRLPMRTGVTVAGARGTVSDFDGGVVISGGSNNRIERLVVRDNIADGTSDFGDGIFINSSSNNVVSRSLIAHNGPFEGIGIFGANSSGNQILDNFIVDNNIVTSFTPNDGFPVTIDAGINLGGLLEAGRATTIRGNTIRGNGFHGILACSFLGVLCVTTDNVIIDNLIELNGFVGLLRNGEGDGIHVSAIDQRFGGRPDLIPTRNHIERNRVRNNADAGIFVTSAQNTIIRNEVRGNGAILFGGERLQIGLDLEDLHNDCDENVWFRNFYETFRPECTTLGGTQQPPSPGTTFEDKGGLPVTSPAASELSSAMNSGEGTASSAVAGPYPTQDPELFDRQLPDV